MFRSEQVRVLLCKSISHFTVFTMGLYGNPYVKTSIALIAIPYGVGMHRRGKMCVYRRGRNAQVEETEGAGCAQREGGMCTHKRDSVHIYRGKICVVQRDQEHDIFIGKGGRACNCQNLNQAECPKCAKTRTLLPISLQFHDLRLHNTLLPLQSRRCECSKLTCQDLATQKLVLHSYSCLTAA